MKSEATAEILSIDGHEVRVTQPGKLYFSKENKLTKLDLLRYYLAVAQAPWPGFVIGPSF